MEIGAFRKLDQKNRLHLPQDLMKSLGMDDNSEVYVSRVFGEEYIRVYPKKYIDSQLQMKVKTGFNE